MQKVIIRGTGQLNGPVIIDKEIELEDNIARMLQGSKKAEILTSIMDTHYPGVKFNPNQIGINISSIIDKKQKINNSAKSAVIGAVVASAVTNKNSNKKQDSKRRDSTGFRKEIEHLLDIEFSENKSIIESQLDTIFITLKSYKWPLRSDRSELNDNNTRIMTQVFEKYKVGYKNLKRSVQDPIEIQEHTKQFKKLRIKKIFNQYGLWIYTVGFILLAILFLSTLE